MKKIRFVKKLRNCGNRSKYDPKKEEVKRLMKRLRNEETTGH
jgi:hypothetical protein